MATDGQMGAADGFDKMALSGSLELGSDRGRAMVATLLTPQSG
jgi:hypothetical protein